MKTGRTGAVPHLMTAPSDLAPFSTLRPSILDERARLRVGRQILAVLEAHLAGAGLAGRRVLDVGCSSGIITSLLADATGPIVGVDIDAEALRLARSRPRKPNLTFQATAGSTLDFPSASFDIVVCNQVYYWMKDQPAFMADVHRVLARGGICFLASVNKYAVWEAQYRLPLLSWLPPWLADAYVRAAGRGARFGCRYRSYWELTRLCSAFRIHRYTARILKDPDRYRFTNVARFEAFTRTVPLAWWEALEPILPNFIWVLEKPRDSRDEQLVGR